VVHWVWLPVPYLSSWVGCWIVRWIVTLGLCWCSVGSFEYTLTNIVMTHHNILTLVWPRLCGLLGFNGHCILCVGLVLSRLDWSCKIGC
jgi:hypothetical protein